MRVKFRTRPIRNFFQIASLLLGLLVVALVSAITTMHFAIHGAEVKVPALKGMTVAEARSQTSGLRLNLEVDDRFYSADVAAGHILSQSPAPGSVVRREWRVRVSESLGPQKVEVPSVTGTPERAAALNLRRVGLEAGGTSYLPDGRAPEGTVLAQDPPPKAQGIERPSVNLLVAAPDDTTTDGFVMPDLVGMPIVTAQAALTRVGIKSAEPKFVDVPLTSIPAVGAAVSAQAGPAPAGNGPALAGNGSAQAGNGSRQAGNGSRQAGNGSGQAVAGSANGSVAAPFANPSPNAPAAPLAPARASALPGTVLSQSPPPGWRVEVGSTVALTVVK